MDQRSFPELNTESDTTLEQPDLDQLRQDRLERNRTFLRSVSGSTAARVLSKEESNTDVQKSAAIIIQKHWRRALARYVYVAMLYEKYMKEEEEQKQRTRQQMEEGELLVENHELEVLLDDNKTTRRNAERRLISKVITIQRAWKAYQERKKKISITSPNERNGTSDDDDEIQDHTNDSIDNLHSNKRSDQGNPDADKPNKPIDNYTKDFSTDTVNPGENDSCFVNPVCAGSSGVTATSDNNVLKKLPKETDEDYQRRLRKHSVLSQAQQFMLLKKENSNLLPFNLHAYDKACPTIECTGSEEESMEINMVLTGECTVCDLNRKANTENLLKGNGGESIVSDKEARESASKNRLTDMPQSKNNNPDTKGGNSENPNEKGDNKTVDEVLSAFDVYNIETALPDIDWKNIEEKLSAARKEEEERLKARRNDREEIRKKLAMGADDDDFYDDNDDDDDDISYKKPNLQSRLHSGLQICFMNESPGDTDSEGLSPRQHEIHDNMKLMSKGDDLVDSDNNLKSVTDLNRTAAGTSQEKSSNSPTRLKEKTTTDQPAKCDDFHSRQEQLQEEAKLALAQAGTMARMQLEIEKQTQTKSPMAEMVGIPGLGERRRKKLGLRKLQEMNLAQIQVLYNDLQTQIENLNEELVHLLMERDELHMEQDSMLVDIEDLTRRAEELAEKSNAKAAAKNSKNHVTGKVGGR